MTPELSEPPTKDLATAAEWQDVTVPLQHGMPCWPGSPGFISRRFRDLQEGGGSRDSEICLDVHCGTHVEGPAHLLPGGEALTDARPLWGVLSALVIDTGEAPQVEPRHLTESGTPFDLVLFKTRNSHADLWSRKEFRDDYAAITSEAALLLAQRPGLIAVGVDYLSVQPYGADPTSHTAFMDRGVLIIEGLDLRQVEAGTYDAIALPIHAPGLEALPLRMLLRRQGETSD